MQVVHLMVTPGWVTARNDMPSVGLKLETDSKKHPLRELFQKNIPRRIATLSNMVLVRVHRKIGRFDVSSAIQNFKRPLSCYLPFWRASLSLLRKKAIHLAGQCV
ncbi:hypothetical protein [Paraburkholderia kururiensis]|uniref:hypothetical protein n=1 Tax=Paraburkholderia kururiensis TaxID=984307 RepID=UPI0012E0A37C|nr:hypothetical protein [Paraburkholderia kururiensis]